VEEYQFLCFAPSSGNPRRGRDIVSLVRHRRKERRKEGRKEGGSEDHYYLPPLPPPSLPGYKFQIHARGARSYAYIRANAFPFQSVKYKRANSAQIPTHQFGLPVSSNVVYPNVKPISYMIPEVKSLSRFYRISACVL
jgi:hypothetical protein